MPENEDFVSAEEAMKLLGVKRTKLYQLIRDGKLKRATISPIRQRQELKFKRSDIENLLKPTKDQTENFRLAA